jgi:hypothetical protein
MEDLDVSTGNKAFEPNPNIKEALYEPMTTKEALRLPNIWEIPLWFEISRKRHAIYAFIFICLSPILLILTLGFTLFNYLQGNLKYRCPVCNVRLSDKCLCYSCTEKMYSKN